MIVDRYTGGAKVPVKAGGRGQAMSHLFIMYRKPAVPIRSLYRVKCGK